MGNTKEKVKMSSKTDTATTSAEAKNSVLARLFEPLGNKEIIGDYDTETQTWSHRDSKVFSPVKNNREM